VNDGTALEQGQQIYYYRSDKKADEKLAEKGAHHDHGKPPKQHLPEKFFSISAHR
jgi:hypothetical protein